MPQSCLDQEGGTGGTIGLQGQSALDHSWPHPLALGHQLSLGFLTFVK